ncbi:putative calcium-transporting ATPase 13, plasma membrane-type isoform X2 [Abrus precatorius]|uniref:Calcium-transporting ATPase 13, plasma membrane-type isoform X2 n=1 Tax=Abrus precatorius TaxID=3816 RepID=A0A8B8JKZ1_ABRPR|nr:putative calcium-transporting ATPase 13, plasma membrane-type isoform X2 [Abrus precatorius]
MSQTQASTCSGGANIEVGATTILLSSKYRKKWRVLYTATGIVISLTKRGNYESPPSPLSSVPYTSLPASEPPARTSSVKSCVAIDVAPDTEEVKEEEDAEGHIRKNIERIVKEEDLKSLHNLGGVDLISSVLLRQRQHSESTIPILGTSFCSFLLMNCKCNGYTILMLLIAAGLSFAIELKQEGPKYGWHDGFAIVFSVFLLVGGNSVANFWRERKMLKLAKRRNKLEFTVERGEESLEGVPLSDIMVLDKVCLRQGDEVPADGLLVSDDILELAEATKSKRGNPFLVSGSKVIRGQGWMLVTSVGSSLSYNPKRGGLLETLIEKPISYIDKSALLISVVITLVVFIRLICLKDGGNSGLPEMKGKVSVGLLMEILERVFLRPHGRVSILTGLVTFAILFVQHGMPLMVTISLKCQIDRVVSNQEAVLNDLSSFPTMGLVTVICIDASGGLMSNPKEVSRIWMGEKDIMSKVEEAETDQVVLDMLKQGVGLSVLNPELSLTPMCHPLVSWAKTNWEMDMKSFTEKFVIVKHSKLDSDKECSRVLAREIRCNEQVLHLHWSGTASTILEKCSSYYDSEGACHAMENQKIKFGQVIKEMEDDGLKSIAFAYRKTDAEELEQDELILLGVIGIKSTCQKSIKPALENLRKTVQIKLISRDDDILAVKGIACELGIEVPPDGIELEGEELQDLNEEARLHKMDGVLVMGSFHLKDLLLMIQEWQKNGEVVAFIGTRMMTNHTSILEEADVGIVHDSLGRIVDRDCFGISMQCFCALEPIVKAGRSIYHNIQKFIQLQLTCTISGLVISLITTISTGDSPLTAFQLIWVNVVMNILGGQMMVMELTSEEQLAKKPSQCRNQSIITKEIWKNIVIQVLYQVSVSIILEFGGHVMDREKHVRKTMIFNTFLLCQLANQLNTMQLLKLKHTQIVLQNYYFLVAFGGCLLMQVLMIEYAKGLSDCMRLNATGWAICVLVGAFSWVFAWLLERILAFILSTNSASQSMTSPSFYLYPAFPFLMFLLFPLGLIFGHFGIKMAFR